MDLTVNGQVKTKKPHACGCSEWTVVRVGADIKLKCNNCGRIVMIPSDKAVKIIKEIK